MDTETGRRPRRPQVEEEPVDLYEFETKERLTREQAAERLRRLADDLERHNEVSLLRDGVPIRVAVPDEVTFKFELELEDDERELEVKLTW